jgi:hypothetical protein
MRTRTARSRTPAPRRRQAAKAGKPGKAVKAVEAVDAADAAEAVNAAKAAKAAKAVVPVPPRSLALRVLLPVVTYGASAIVHGAVVHLHGTSCGVCLWDYRHWHLALFTTGSTWCRALSVVMQGTTLLNEHSAVHLLSLLF